MQRGGTATEHLTKALTIGIERFGGSALKTVDRLFFIPYYQQAARQACTAYAVIACHQFLDQHTGQLPLGEAVILRFIDQ
jgi:hypothetical protein